MDNDVNQLTRDEQGREETRLVAVDAGSTAASLAESPAHKSTTFVVDSKIKELLDNPKVQEFISITAEEGIKADLAAIAAGIRQKNIETAEKEFDTETRTLRLKQCKEKLNLDHKYEMSILADNAKHKQMLDKRKKLEEKYGYLYERDEQGNIVDFSYSETVNKIRAFVRNVSKLDVAVKKALKWLFISVVIITVFALLKRFQII